MVFNFSLIFMLSLFPGFVHACGILTHTEIGYRAVHQFKTTTPFNFHQLLLKHSDAFQAGLPYPDTFYSTFCHAGTYHNISEDTHFAPFINATVNYIKKHYSEKPWNKAFQRLKSYHQRKLVMDKLTDEDNPTKYKCFRIFEMRIDNLHHLDYSDCCSHLGCYSHNVSADVTSALLQNAEKLVAFLFGITSHQVADILWHSLGLEQGFLQTMASVNFHGSFSEAHPWGDIGGDVMNSYEQNITYIPTWSDPHSWYIPTTDLFNIYQELYGMEKISETVILECFQELYLARIAELLAFPKLYDVLARESPFLVQQLDDFFLGGLDDMSGWTEVIWDNVAEMLLTNTSSCVIPYNTLCLQCTKHRNTNIVCNSSDNALEESVPPPSLTVAREAAGYLGLTHKHIDVQPTLKGFFIKPSLKLKKKLQFTKAVSLNQKMSSKEMNLPRMQMKRHSMYTVANSYSKFGWSLTTGDVDNDGIDDLVIGAPGYSTAGNPQQGCIFVIYGNSSGMRGGQWNLDSSQAFSCGLPKMQSRFGASVAILDLNIDGIKDVVVGAPSSNNFPSLEYHGEVSVFYGEKMKRRNLKTRDLVIKCSQHTYCNLGWQLSAMDINGDGHNDLVVSTPFLTGPGSQRGCVASLFANQSLTASKALEFDQLQWIQCGYQDFGWFGYSLAISKENNFQGKAGKLLAVGEPLHRICEFSNCSFSNDDQQSVGRVHLYFLGVDTTPVYLSYIPGLKNFSQFGASLAFGRPFHSTPMVLAVGATSNDVKGSDGFLPLTFYQAGTVYLFDVSTLNHQNNILTAFSADRLFGLFGATLQFSDVNQDTIDDLIISSPFRKNKIVGNSGVESGRVYVYFGGNNFPVGNATSQCRHSTIIPCPGEKASLQFSTDEEKARFGSAVTAYKFKKQVFLVVSSLHSSSGDRLSGSVSLYKIQPTNP